MGRDLLSLVKLQLQRLSQLKKRLLNRQKKLKLLAVMTYQTKSLNLCWMNYMVKAKRLSLLYQLRLLRQKRQSQLKQHLHQLLLKRLL